MAASQAPALATALTAAATTIAHGVRRSFAWHEDWLAFSDAWADINRSVGTYRVTPVEQRTQKLKQHLVAEVDEIVLAETRRWSERRRGIRDDVEKGR